MSRFGQIADNLRLFISNDDQRITDHVVQLGTEYAAGCRLTNERLARCMDLLRQGLRSEAIQLAEAEPPVTELVTELDLAELRSAWEELCSTYDLPKAEPLRLELAEAIHEAYAELEPIGALLDRHRRLALARAPLSSRIEVLRRLAEADPQTTFWEDDLRDYERVRLREVEAEAREAARDGHPDRLKAIVEELAGPGWRQPPGEEIQRKIRSLGGQVARQSARKELEAIEPDLHAAFASLDLATARAARVRWLEASERAKLNGDDPLAERVAPVLGWLADEDAREEQDRAFRLAVADLEAAVEKESADLQVIDRKAHAAARFDRELPPALVVAYRNRRASLQAGERSRRVLIVGSSLLGLVVVVAFVSVVLWRAGLAHQARQLAGEVTRLTEEGKLAEARKLFDEHKDISTDEVWLSARRTLEAAEQADAQRQAAYTAAVEAATGADDSAEAERLLKVARENARTPDEKLQTARLERTWQDRRNAAFEESEKRFRAAAADASEILVRLDGSVASASTTTLEKMLGEAVTAIGGLGRLTADVRPAVAAERDVLAARLAALQTVVGERREREKLFAEVTAALKPGGAPMAVVDRHLGAIEAYRKRLPKDPRSGEFGDVSAEAELWRGAIAWRAETEGWTGVRPESAESAAKRLAVLDRLLAAYPSAPDTRVGKRCASFLRTIAARYGPDGIDSMLLGLFRAPLILGPLYVLRTNDGRSYYLTENKNFAGGLTAGFTHVVGPDARRDTRSKLIPLQQLVSSKTALAPQVSIAEAVRRDLPNTTPATWEAYMIELAKQTLSEDQIDPFLQHLLLSEVLSAASNGSELLGTALKDVRSRLEDEEIDPAARWMDPDNTDAARSRRRAEAALGRISRSDLDAALRASRDTEAALDREFAVTYKLVGWLRRDGDRWECSGQAIPEAATPVAVVVPGGTSEAASWEMIGTWGAAGTDLHGTGLKQGRLVFAVGKRGERAR